MAKGPLKRIKTNALVRSFALAKVSMSAGARVASHAVGGLFAKEADRPDRLKALLISQMDHLAKELGQLKGSLMKVGQMLSMYGEHFLPPEATVLLKTLQSQSPPLEWKAIEKVIRKQLSAEVLSELEISVEPMASASLGQVHQAIRKSDGRKLAMKIQYPGVDKAIEGDLKSLRSIMLLSKVIPSGGKTDQIFEEVKKMLRQEVDYSQELKWTQYFREALKDDPRYVVPEVFEAYCTHRILVTSLEDGVAVDSEQVKQLSQERRNQMGMAAVDLYLRELFEFHAVQTDPHLGNYRIRIAGASEGGSSHMGSSIVGAGSASVTTANAPQPLDQLVLLDFGAVRLLTTEFADPYLVMVRGALAHNSKMIIQGAQAVGFLRPEDTDEQKAGFVDLCTLLTEPFHDPNTTPGISKHLFDSSGAYDWGASDLPKRVARMGAEFAFLMRLRLPPSEIVFLDRKLGGIFVFLSGLKVRLKGTDMVARILQ